MTPPESDATFRVGDVLNNTFRIEAVLGRGGTSEVFRARNEISDRFVALKVLRAEFAGNEDFLVLMKREEEMRDIRHDAVVGYSEIHRTAEGLIYLVMDFVDGPSLEARMLDGGVSAEDLLVVARRVAQGLHVAHERRIVHRDLSPDNIILKGGDPGRAVIIDFGIAKDSNPGAKTVVGSEFAGKFAYAAPEQMGGNVDLRSDIYSLGMTLLATFRGAHPNMGDNLIQVLERKKETPDISGVPEPLHGLLQRMLEPDPELRFQSTQQILSEISRIEAGLAGVDDVSNILHTSPLSARSSGATPSPAARPAATPKSATSEQPRPDSKPAEKKSGRAPLLVGLLVLLLAGGGGAAWFMGLFGTSLPVVEPYVLTAEQGDLGGPMLAGHVPTQELLDRLASEVSDAGGSQSLSLARGDLAEGWSSAVQDALEAASDLDIYRLDIEGNRITLTGRTGDAGVRDRLEAYLADARPVGMELRGRIDFSPPNLSANKLAPLLTEMADCGPLKLSDTPAQGYGMDDTIVVTGTLSGTDARLALYDRLAAVADGRDVKIDTEVLNPALCLAETSLPAVLPGGMEIDFFFGETGQSNSAGRFFVGENPVIDVIMPEGMETGYLYVSIIDVTGSVFHLLPNLNRSENAVAALRGTRTGTVPVRVAFPVAEAAPDRIAFLVDDSLLGKSKVMVLHSDGPIFDTLRPTAESVEGYVEALAAVQATGSREINTFDSRVLEMVAP